MRRHTTFHLPTDLIDFRLVSGSPAMLGAAGLLAALLLVVGLVVAYQVGYAERVYPGVRALGQDLGGYSRQDARAALQQQLDELAQRQVTLRYQELSWSLTAQELGLRADVDPILEAVMKVGREGNLFERFTTQLGLWRQGRSFEQPASAFDEAAQAALLERLAREIDRPVVEPKLTVRPDFRVDLQPAQAGRKLDIAASRARLRQALADPSRTTADLVVQETPPKNAGDNLALARDQAARILSGPITVRSEDKSWTLDQTQLASILHFDERPDAAEPAYLDRPALQAWVQSLAKVVNQSPQDARFAWNGGKLDVLRPSRDGVELDEAAAVDAVIAAASGDQRDLALPTKITRPAVPMESRYDLGIKELIETAKTPFAGSVAAKQHNITLAAQRLNGVVVPPGGTFSFNKELGSTSLDAGWQIGWGITTAGDNVKTVPSVAGGICQVATTLFHTVFWSGYQVEERNWHLYWIPAYTSKGVVGLDATVDEEAGLDFQFINPTKTAVLIQSWVDDGLNVNFALYGTKPDWVVKVEPSVKTDVIPAETGVVNVEEEPSMPEGSRLQVESARDGFTVTNIRHVLQGDDDRTLRLVSRYRPARNVILVGTGGRPASGRTIVETNKPAPEADKPKPTPAASSTPGAAPAAAPTAGPTKTSAAPTPKPTSKPSSNRPAPTATPKKR